MASQSIAVSGSLDRPSWYLPIIYDPAIRLAALMRQPVIFIFTHDSIYVGEDGPTHQPVEQLESLRLIPNLQVIRPADANETAWAWLEALYRTNGPVALVLSRQKLPTLIGTSREGFIKGGYVVQESAKPRSGNPGIGKRGLVGSGSGGIIGRKRQSNPGGLRPLP